MKKGNNNQKKETVLSEAGEGLNLVRLIQTTSEGEEETCPWSEVDKFSGRSVVAGYRFDSSSSNTSELYHPWIAYSTDGGKTWMKSTTTSQESQAHGQLYALTYGGGRFVVAGYRYGTSSGGGTSNNNHPWIAYSEDGGKTWTKSATTSDEGQTHGMLQALAYGGGRFVVAGYRYGISGGTTDNYHPWIAYSVDGGVTWTKSDTTSQESQAHGRLQALTYGGGRFVVAGYRYDTSSSTSDNYHPWIAYSTDGGVTWTPITTTSDEGQAPGQLHALTYGPDSYCWKWSVEKNEEEEEI